MQIPGRSLKQILLKKHILGRVTNEINNTKFYDFT